MREIQHTHHAPDQRQPAREHEQQQAVDDTVQERESDELEHGLPFPPTNGDYSSGDLLRCRPYCAASGHAMSSPVQLGRCILHVVGSAVSLALILVSVLNPTPLFSTSYFTLSDMVETNIGIRIWWLSARISTSPTVVFSLSPSSAFATFTGSFDLAFFVANVNRSKAVFRR